MYVICKVSGTWIFSLVQHKTYCGFQQTLDWKRKHFSLIPSLFPVTFFMLKHTTMLLCSFLDDIACLTNPGSDITIGKMPFHDKDILSILWTNELVCSRGQSLVFASAPSAVILEGPDRLEYESGNLRSWKWGLPHNLPWSCS